MAFCSLCRQIPGEFFSQEPTEKGKAVDYSSMTFAQDAIDHHHHPTRGDLERSASLGCPLCKLLLSTVAASPACRNRGADLELVFQRFRPSSAFTFHRNATTFGLGVITGFMPTFATVHYSRVPSSWARILPLSRMDVPNDRLLLMKSWISECENGHPACTVKGDGFRPTRLLDLEKFKDSRDVALISTADSPSGNAHYVTLSHGWDRSKRGPFPTVSANIDQRMRRISFDELPLTFQDAVDITRKLDVRYLWIDSLCMVQDQPEDVEQETAAMGQIYEQSYCTLAAASSHDEHGGCRVNAGKSAQKEPFRYLDIELHTERDTLLWECQTTQATEELPWAQMKAKGTLPGWLYNASHEFAAGDSRSLELRQHWCRVVEDYTTRALQSERDKVPVLSGLVRRYQESCLRGRYVAGLWESDLPSALLWQTRKPQELTGGGQTGVPEPRRRVQYRAPSWSWPAIEGAVGYESQQLCGSWGGTSPSDMRDLVKRDPADEVDFRDLRITEIALSARGADPAGALSNGYMCLTGRLKRAVFSSAVIHDEEWDFDEEGKELWGPGGEIVGIVFADVSGELQDKEEVFCLRIRMEHKHGNHHPPERMGCRKNDGGIPVGLWMGLALVKTGEAENAYRRVGLVRSMRDPWFDDVEPTEILIF